MSEGSGRSPTRPLQAACHELSLCNPGLDLGHGPRTWPLAPRGWSGAVQACPCRQWSLQGTVRFLIPRRPHPVKNTVSLASHVLPTMPWLRRTE